jgi:RNA polymerase-binding transcription factor DksA
MRGPHSAATEGAKLMAERTKPGKVAAKKPAKKAAPAKKPVKKAPTAKKVAKKPVKKAAPAKKPVKKPAKKAAPAAKKVAKKAVPAKKVAPAKKPVKKAAPAAKKAAPAKKVVKKKMIGPKPKRRPREDETPWTAEELRSVREALLAEVTELEQNIETAEAGLADLIRDSGDGAGDDQADAGSKTFEREHEMSLARNYRDSLDQAQRALARIEAKTYGICESCGNPIGKFRLQAFPRATLCVLCKEAEERY